MLSHRSRLVLTTVASCGLLMATVLTGIALLFRANELRTVREGMGVALDQLREDVRSSENPDLEEAHEGYPGVTFAWFDPRGKLVAKSGPLKPADALGFRKYGLGGQTLLTDGFESPKGTITATTDWTAKEAELWRLNLSLAFIWLLIEVVVAGVSWYAAKATFQPLEELTRQAAQLSGEDLAARLNSPDEAEFGSFARQLNSLLDRIEATARREEQFAADAAHELRTPLTTLLASLETTLMKERSREEYRGQVEMMVPEVERLARLVELLLQSTRGKPELADPIELKPALEGIAARWRDRFEESGAHLESQLCEVKAAITEDELGSVLDNLLENALRYSPPGTTAILILDRADGQAIIKVKDQGQGVPAELAPYVFDRLTTGEKSRTRSGGYGIGLALCRSIVSSREGEIALSNRQEGAEFVITLPSRQP